MMEIECDTCGELFAPDRPNCYDCAVCRAKERESDMSVGDIGR